KYANPADPEQTWTGRGRKPRWVQEALGAGQKLESLEI
ncbi:MAG TPA: H-NS histone family protein, partial [Paracoccus sp. (in: a-proteobacteria)]|nr:H-NS histone family protein [Paracoccus sp. (in: a-proteobacteria)]